MRRITRSSRGLVSGLVLLLAILAAPADAQYFGRNKVQWEAFHFKKLQTQHFDIYYYEQETDVVNDIGRMAERWYSRLSREFGHTFARKPIVLYANPADFQQTTTTGEMIGEGTGGFTDEFMNRVVLPLTGDYAENDHVLGHELVHVFQYDIAAHSTTGTNSNRRRFNLEQLPLWIVEGMAEYFSKGRIDPLTAMWMRDSTIHNRLPDLRKLTRDPRYFPYRYGQALFAYMGGRFGDQAVVRFFLASGSGGIEPAFERATGITSDQFFRDWHAASHELYDPIVRDRPATLGTPVIGTTKRVDFSNLNVGPALSPDGNYISFLSSRELFSIDLFLADAKSGRVIRKLVSADRDAHFEALRFIDSAGGWSPDSKHLAFAVFARGDNYLGIVDVETRKIQTIRIPGVDSLTNPVYSPDGHTIALSGQTSGVTDIFLFDTANGAVRRLTNDKYADLQPTFSPDGTTVAFVTDRGTGSSLDQLHFNDLRIGLVNVSSGEVRTLPLFQNAKHINPQYAPDGASIYFISNPEGIPDVYRYTFASNTIQRLTHVQTGVSGITELSPAMSVAARTGEMAISIFENDNYNIYTLPATASGPPASTTITADPTQLSLLPPMRAAGSEITTYLQHPEEGLPTETSFPVGTYSPRLHIAYLGPPTVGAGSDRFGYGVGGNISAYFSDILGQHNLSVAVEGGYQSGYGSIADQIGADIFYLNQTHRFNYGAEVSHIPYVSGYTGYGQTVVDINGQPVLADQIQQVLEITTVDNANLLAQYPFSATRRIEASGGLQRYSFKTLLQTITAIGDQVIDQHTEHLNNGESLNLARASAAFVGDSTTFGFLSPIRGTRYRYEIEALTGDIKFETLLADWRKYYFARPVTFAVRGLHYGRYGSGADDTRLTPLYLGDPGLVRGYDFGSLGPSDCSQTLQSCPAFDRLIGSRVALASAELRIPLTGTKEFGVFGDNFLPTEFYLFGDGGAAWSSGQSPRLRFETNSTERVPVFSAGAGLRILLAYIPLEVYYAKPFQRPGVGWQFGFNIQPGW